MTRRDIALYKLASFSQKMQKQADGGPGYWDTLKGNAGSMGLLGLTGLLAGTALGGDKKLKRGLIGAVGLPSLYAAYLAAKHYGNWEGWSPIDRVASAANAGYNAVKDDWQATAPPPAPKEPATDLPQ